MSPGRAGAALATALVLASAVFVVGVNPAPVSAATMCPPVTIDDLFPPPSRPTRTTRPSTPTTEPASPSSTIADTSTTTTTVVEEPSTTVPAEPTTTAGPSPSSTAPPGPGSTRPTTPTRPGRCTTPFVYDMVWPIMGNSTVISSFGADRDGGARHHLGIDIHAPKLTPVVAVADGRVLDVHQEVGTEKCCSIKIRHDDGWTSSYVHLNNDSHGTDDGLGFGVRTDLAPGDDVVAGQVIGWVGDSGNAEDTVDHLHFELHQPSGVAVDPAPSLRAARVDADLPDPETVWPYVDDEGLVVQWPAADLVTSGLLLACDETGLMLCPDELADPDFVRAIAGHFAGTEAPVIEGHQQDVPDVFAPVQDESRVMVELMGCDTAESCLPIGVTEKDVARLAWWAQTQARLTSATDPDLAHELGQVAELEGPAETERSMRSADVIGSCRPPLDGERLVTRGEAIVAMVRWVTGASVGECLDGGVR